MGCRELEIRDYFHFVEAPKKSHSRAQTSSCTQKNAYSGFSHTVIPNYRYYSAELGRWLSRDPIREIAFQLVQEKETPENFETLYGFVSNDAINGYDNLGTVGPASPIAVISTGIQITPSIVNFAVCKNAQKMCFEDAIAGNGRYINYIEWLSINPPSWKTYISICCVCPKSISFTCMDHNGGDVWCQ